MRLRHLTPGLGELSRGRFPEAAKTPFQSGDLSFELRQDSIHRVYEL